MLWYTLVHTEVVLIWQKYSAFNSRGGIWPDACSSAEAMLPHPGGSCELDEAKGKGPAVIPALGLPPLRLIGLLLDQPGSESGAAALPPRLSREGENKALQAMVLIAPGRRQAAHLQPARFMSRSIA